MRWGKAKGERKKREKNVRWGGGLRPEQQPQPQPRPNYLQAPYVMTSRQASRMMGRARPGSACARDSARRPTEATTMMAVAVERKSTADRRVHGLLHTLWYKRLGVCLCVWTHLSTSLSTSPPLFLSPPLSRPLSLSRALSLFACARGSYRPTRTAEIRRRL